MVVPVGHGCSAGRYLGETISVVPGIGIAASCREIAVVVVCVGNSVYRGGSVGIGIVGASVGV